jgi:hypothetical protein
VDDLRIIEQNRIHNPGVVNIFAIFGLGQEVGTIIIT